MQWSVEVITARMVTLLFSSLLLLGSSLGPGWVSGACLPSYTEIGGGCFLAIKDAPGDFLSSRELYQNFNGDLAIVDDCALLGDLAAYLASPGVDIGMVWIGGTDVASEGTWRWTDGRELPLGAPFWGRFDPNSFSAEPSGGVDQNCAVMAVATGYYFKDWDCDNTLGSTPLCQISPLDDMNVTCPSPYVSVGGSCLEFFPSLDVSWGDARTVCQINGGDLAKIDDCHLMAAVINYAKENALEPVGGFWIGASDVASEGTWTWLDGSSVAMGVPFWGRTDGGPLQPDDAGTAGQDCLCMGNDRHFFLDYPCSSEAIPLCQSNVI